MKKLIVIGLITIVLVSMYLFRIDLLHYAVPIIASNYGVKVDSFELAKVDIKQIQLDKLVFSQTDDYSSLSVELNNMHVDINASIETGVEIVAVNAQSANVLFNTFKENESSSDVSVKEYVKLLPAYGVQIRTLDVAILDNDTKQVNFAGVLDYKDAMHLSGIAEVKHGVIKVDLLIDSNDVSISLIDADSHDELLILQGDYNIDDDWLLLNANGTFSQTSMIPVMFEDKADYQIQYIAGEFVSKAELDLVQPLAKALQQSVIKTDADVSIGASSDYYAVDEMKVDMYAECLMRDLRIDNCEFNQPQQMIVEFSQTPAVINDYLGREFKKYYVYLNPGDLIRLKYNSQLDEYYVEGDANILLKVDSPDLKVGLSLHDAEFSWGAANRSGSAGVALTLDARQLNYVADMQRALLKINGRVEADQQTTTLYLDQDSSLALFDVEYDDFLLGRLETLPLTDATGWVNHDDNSVRMSQLKLSLTPRGMRYLENDVMIDKAIFDINQYSFSAAGVDMDSNLTIQQAQVKKQSFSIHAADLATQIDLHKDQLIAQGGFLLGSKQAPLKFSLTNSTSSGSGHISFESQPISLINNEVIAQIIGVTGFPLQVNDGSFTLDGNVHWQDNYQHGNTIVNLSALQVDGDYAQNQFEDLNVKMRLKGEEGWVLAEPTELTIASVNMGIPLQDIQMQIETYEYGVSAQPAVKIVDFYAGALDGSIFSDAIDIDLNKSVNKFSLFLSSLSLEKLIELNQTQDLIATGNVNGELPMVLNEGVLEINQGWMEADEQGGVIQYGRVKEVLKGNQDLALVAELLEDFQYNEMSALVNLTPDGALRLETKLYGRSPDAEFDAPVNLNFNIDLNLWKFLESARLLTRIGEDITEQVSSPKR